MELKIFQSLWAYDGPPASAIASAESFGFDGIEGRPPRTPHLRKEMRERLNAYGLNFIAEITTGGDYVPEPGGSVEDHISSFEIHAEAAMEMNPLFLTVIGGCDAWTLSQSVEFCGTVIELADQLDVTVSFETHRSRSLFNPWATRDILRQLPKMKLTCDFSHWCVVSERLVMDAEPDVLALCARHAHHVHARVGYDQGPQVPHPAAPEYRPALDAHERWWIAIWEAQDAQQRAFTTLTPEFGPDGYLHTLPYTKAPVADLNNINRWMAHRQRENFSRRRALLPVMSA